MRIVVHELAQAELDDAAAFYEQRRPGLGLAFIESVEAAVASVATNPRGGRAVRRGVRWWLVRRFPYRVFYRLAGADLRILAIGNTKRRPFYWVGRG